MLRSIENCAICCWKLCQISKHIVIVRSIWFNFHCNLITYAIKNRIELNSRKIDVKCWNSAINSIQNQTYVQISNDLVLKLQTLTHVTLTNCSNLKKIPVDRVQIPNDFSKTEHWNGHLTVVRMCWRKNSKYVYSSMSVVKFFSSSLLLSLESQRIVIATAYKE